MTSRSAAEPTQRFVVYESKRYSADGQLGQPEFICGKSPALFVRE
jgi:hypothetical protein